MQATRQTSTVVSQAMRESGTPGVSSLDPMAPALTPDLALEYLAALSADVRDGVVLDAEGTLLAGTPALAPVAGELVGAMGEGTEAVGRAAHGVVLAARAQRLAIVLVCGSQAIEGLALHDLRLVLADLGAGVPAAPPAPVVVRHEHVEGAISAAQRAPGARSGAGNGS